MSGMCQAGLICHDSVARETGKENAGEKVKNMLSAREVCMCVCVCVCMCVFCVFIYEFIYIYIYIYIYIENC